MRALADRPRRSRQTDEWVVATLQGEMSWCIAVDEAGTTGPDRSEADEVLAATPTESGVRLVDADGGWAVRSTIAAPPGAADADLPVRCACRRRAAASRVVVAVDLEDRGVARPQGEVEMSLPSTSLSPRTRSW